MIERMMEDAQHTFWKKILQEYKEILRKLIIFQTDIYVRFFCIPKKKFKFYNKLINSFPFQQAKTILKLAPTIFHNDYCATQQDFNATWACRREKVNFIGLSTFEICENTRNPIIYTTNPKSIHDQLQLLKNKTLKSLCQSTIVLLPNPRVTDFCNNVLEQKQ